jgi:hypothetical protein
VRNLDTGEAIHVSEIEERIAAGQQPQSLRPLARGLPPVGFFASLFNLRGPAAVPLEPCLRPLPLLSIAGDLTNGSHLRLVVARDRFVTGDGLARALASVANPNPNPNPDPDPDQVRSPLSYAMSSGGGRSARARRASSCARAVPRRATCQMRTTSVRCSPPYGSPRMGCG